VGDTGDRLAERRHLLRLQQLLVEIARLIVLDPHGGSIHPPHPQQVVGDGPVVGQPFEEGFACGRIGKTIGGKRRDVLLPGLGGIAKNQLEVRVGGQRCAAAARARRRERADEHALVDRFE
jgi:hypothetical protein